MLYKWCVLCIPIGSSVEKTLCYFVLGNINLHLRKKKKKKKRKGGGTGPYLADLNIQVIQHTRHLGRWKAESLGMEEMDDQVTSTPDIIDVFCPMSNSRAAPPPPLRQEANKLSINQTQSIDSCLVSRSTNELGFDRYEVFQTLNLSVVVNIMCQ